MTMIMMTTRIPERLKLAVEEKACQEKRTKQVILARLIERGLVEEEKEKQS